MFQSKKRQAPRWHATDTAAPALGARLGGLPLGGTRWKQRAANALLATEALGIEPRLAALIARTERLPAYFLAAQLGVPLEPGVTVESLTRQVAATVLAVPNGENTTLWRAVAARCSPTSGTSMNTQGVGPRPAEGLAEFCQSVLDAIATSGREWLGGGKVLIHHAWEAWRRVGASAGLTLPEFKDRLLAGMRAGLVQLSRADFHLNMANDDLIHSELCFGGEIYNFVALRGVHGQ